MSIAQSAEEVLDEWCKCGVHRQLLGRALEWHARFIALKSLLDDFWGCLWVTNTNKFIIC